MRLKNSGGFQDDLWIWVGSQDLPKKGFSTVRASHVFPVAFKAMANNFDVTFIYQEISDGHNTTLILVQDEERAFLQWGLRLEGLTSSAGQW